MSMSTKTLLSELSTEELRMFRDLGKGQLLSILGPNDVASLYRLAMEKAFVGECHNALAVAALQRAMAHFRVGGFRGNTEFNKLISY